MFTTSYIATKNTLNSLNPDISCFGYAELDQKWHGQNVIRTYNRLYLVESGVGYLKQDDTLITMRPGYAYLIPAGLCTDHWCDTVMTKLYFHFNLFRPDHYDLFYFSQTIMEVPVSSQTLEDLHKHGKGLHFADSMITKYYFFQILTEMQKAYGFAQEPFPNYSEYVMDTINYINQNLSASLKVEDLAKRLFVSRSFLAEQFRKEVGVSIGRYIDDQLMTEAQWRLGQSSDSIMQISQALGYGDQCYFSRRFKQLTGMSPQLYRKRHRI
jgi:AraC family transcriptional regulator of arabinose operon